MLTTLTSVILHDRRILAQDHFANHVGLLHHILGVELDKMLIHVLMDLGTETMKRCRAMNALHDLLGHFPTIGVCALLSMLNSSVSMTSVNVLRLQ